MADRKLSFKEREGLESIEKPFTDLSKELHFQIERILEEVVDNISNERNVISIYEIHFSSDLYDKIRNSHSLGHIKALFKLKIKSIFDYNTNTFRYYNYFEFVEFFIHFYCENVLTYLDDDYDFRWEKDINLALVRFNSKWRLVNYQFVRIVNDEEISTIKETLNHKLDPIKKHSREALALMKGEDASFTNSIKESLNMVEAALQHVTNVSKLNLDPMVEILKKKEQRLVLTKELEAISTLHGVASSKKGRGIRHAAQEDIAYIYEDALYLYVRCSAFVNWVLATYPKVA